MKFSFEVIKLDADFRVSKGKGGGGGGMRLSAKGQKVIESSRNISGILDGHCMNER